jgi:hypothetical protein
MTNTTLEAWPVWDLRVIERADRRVLVLALVAGVAFDIGVRTELASLGGALAAAVAAAALLASGRLHTLASRVCAGGAAGLGVFLTFRSSEWLVAFDVLAIAALLVLAGLLARDGRLSDLPARLLAARAVVAVGHGLGAAAFLLAPLRPLLSRRPPSAVVRGVALAAPIVLVLGALLQSADVVFASMLSVDVAVPDDVVGHVLLAIVGALGVGGILRAASSTSDGTVPALGRRLGGIEWTIVLGSVVLLFGAFAAAQVVTITGGADHVLKTEGLTYAQYARTGYVQLLVVAALTGVVLGVLSAVSARASTGARHRFTLLAELVVVLTGVILVVAVRRLALYEDAYGWTMLRVCSKAFAVWLGLGLVLAAVRLGGAGRDRDWFVPAAIGAGLAVLVALNVANPEALVARHNLELDRELDPAYLVQLSDDAVPVLAAHPELREQVCAGRSDRQGLLSWNLASSRADDVCAAD